MAKVWSDELSSSGFTDSFKDKMSRALVESDKMIKISEKLIEICLHGQGSKSDFFSSSVTKLSDAVMDLTAANQHLNNIYKFRRMPDKSTANLDGAETQVQACSVAHKLCKEMHQVLRSLQKGS